MDNVSPVVLSDGLRAPSASASAPSPRLASGGAAMLAHHSGSVPHPTNEFALISAPNEPLGEYAQGKGATLAAANEDDHESEFEGSEVAPVEVSAEQRLLDIQQQQAQLSAQYAFLAKSLTHALDARLAQTLALMDEAAQTGQAHEALENIYHSHLEDLEDRFCGVSVVEASHKFTAQLITASSQKNRGIVWRDFAKQRHALQRDMGDQLAAEMVALFKDKRNSQMGDPKVYDWISSNLKAVECLGPVKGLDAQAAKGDLEAIKQKLDNARPKVDLSEFDNLEDENDESLQQLAELAQQHHQMPQVPQVPQMTQVPPQSHQPPAEEGIPITSHSTARSRSSSVSKGVRHHSDSPAPKRHRHTNSYAQAQQAPQLPQVPQVQVQTPSQQQQQLHPQPQPQHQHQHQPHQQHQLPTPQPQVHTPHMHQTPSLPVQSPYQAHLPQPQMLQLPLPGPQQFGQMMSPQPGFAHMNGQGMYGVPYEQQFYMQGQPVYMPQGAAPGPGPGHAPYEQQQFVPQHWVPQKGFPQMYQPQHQPQAVQFFYERPMGQQMQMGTPQGTPQMGHPQQPQQYYSNGFEAQ